MNKLTPYEKTVLYNMVFDRLYSIKMQDVSKDIYKEYLERWEHDLEEMLEKMKQQGWNDYEKIQTQDQTDRTV